MKIKTKRIYDPPAPDDGIRILVDRVWPRGVSKEHAHIDLWAKELAPSTNLREWFAHDPTKWEEFKRRYFAELSAHPSAARFLEDHRGAPDKHITFVYSAHDMLHNQAVALKEYFESI